MEVRVAGGREALLAYGLADEVADDARGAGRGELPVGGELGAVDRDVVRVPLHLYRAEGGCNPSSDPMRSGIAGDCGLGGAGPGAEQTFAGGKLDTRPGPGHG